MNGVRPFGLAGPKIARQLREKGGTEIIAAQGFFVTAAIGPLADGEGERAGAWGKEIASLFEPAPAL